MSHRRPSLVYTPGASLPGSRSSSRASTPSMTRLQPAERTRSSSLLSPRANVSGDYFSSHNEQNQSDMGSSLAILRRSLPSTPTMLHYLSLALSIRLLLRSPRWTSIILVAALLLTLEARARAERLGLRNTMAGVLGVVGLGLAWPALSFSNDAMGRHGLWVTVATLNLSGLSPHYEAQSNQDALTSRPTRLVIEDGLGTVAIAVTFYSSDKEGKIGHSKEESAVSEQHLLMTASSWVHGRGEAAVGTSAASVCCAAHSFVGTQQRLSLSVDCPLTVSINMSKGEHGDAFSSGPLQISLQCP